MSDVEQLFGSESEDDKGAEDGVGNRSGGDESNSGSSSSASESGSDNEKEANHSSSASEHSDKSAPASPNGSGPASPSGSGPASPSGSGPASPAGPGSASPNGSGSASPVAPGPGSPAGSQHSGRQSASAPSSPANSASSSGSSHSSPAGTPERSTPQPGSPAGSGSPKRSRSQSGSPERSRSQSGSPARSRSPAGSHVSESGSAVQEKRSSRSGSRSPPASPKRVDSDSDSDIPTKSKNKIEDSDGESEDGKPVARRQERLPSDSGSDPDAVRATAEDIFGEADDISEDEKEKGGEEQDEEKEEIPETRIEVEIPRVVADLGKTLSFAKLPNFLSVETRPFDPASYEDEIDEDEVMDEEGRARLKLKVENTIRWRYAKDPTTGEIVTDEFGEKIRESNSKVVKWSDGTVSLHLGTEVFDVFSMPMQDHNHLYIRQGTGLQGQAMFRNKLTFRPHSTDSFTHRKMTMSLADRSTKSAKIKVLPIAGVDPELSKNDNIKKEEERLRASIRRENQQRRTRERAHARSSLDANFLDDEMDVSVAAIKNKYKKSKNVKRERSVEMSDSAEEDYETDEEESMRRNRLQKAKRLADSDDNSSGADDQDSSTETVKKKSKVMSGSESD